MEARFFQVCFRKRPSFSDFCSFRRLMAVQSVWKLRPIEPRYCKPTSAAIVSPISTRAHVHATTDTDCLTIIGTGWLLALSAAAAGKLAREEDWPALIPKSGRVSDFTNGARGKRECFEQLRERVPRDKHSDRKIETLNLESARLEKL